MKVISLLQPWASLVGIKEIETRSWARDHRGPLSIHASMAFPKKTKDLCQSEPFTPTLLNLGFKKDMSNLPLGKIITACNLTEIVEMTEEFIKTVSPLEYAFGIYAVGRFAWMLKDIKRLDKPISVKGQLGLWNFDFDRTEVSDEQDQNRLG